MALDQAAIVDFLTQSFDDVEPGPSVWGDTFFYNPDLHPEPSVYFATLKSADDHGDRASNLDRPLCSASTSGSPVRLIALCSGRSRRIRAKETAPATRSSMAFCPILSTGGRPGSVS